MKNFFSVLSCLFLAGCGSMGSSKGEKHQIELSLHKVRTEVEDIKHDLNTYQIEHHVIEGKLIDQEQTIAMLRQQIVELKSGKLDSFVNDLQQLDKKLHQISKKQEKIVADIRQLSTHANDTTTAFAQYKDKITQFEKKIQEQHAQLGELKKMKDSYSAEEDKRYCVKPGDSLEKIARRYNTTVEKLKELNKITGSDLIVVDQLIYLP